MEDHPPGYVALGSRVERQPNRNWLITPCTVAWPRFKPGQTLHARIKIAEPSHIWICVVDLLDKHGYDPLSLLRSLPRNIIISGSQLFGTTSVP
jgi:hypothetical protein